MHNVAHDEQTGSVTVKSKNIKKIVVKYYLIDTEILFSRSPFVQDEAEKFSFVKPYLNLEHAPSAASLDGEQTTTIELIE